MKALFVSLHDGQRDVHWTKLSAFSIALLAMTSAIAVGSWYLLTGTLSVGALIVGLLIGVFAVVRVVARAVTYQQQELEVESPVATS